MENAQISMRLFGLPNALHKDDSGLVKQKQKFNQWFEGAEMIHQTAFFSQVYVYIIKIARDERHKVFWREKASNYYLIGWHSNIQKDTIDNPGVWREKSD